MPAIKDNGDNNAKNAKERQERQGRNQIYENLLLSRLSWRPWRSLAFLASPLPLSLVTRLRRALR
jgi:hypothetical protein